MKKIAIIKHKSSHRLLPIAYCLLLLAFSLFPFSAYAQPSAFDCSSGECFCATGNCEELKKIGEIAEYVAEPEPGWYFAGWLTNISGCGTNPTCRFTVKNQRYYLYAIFAQQPQETLHVYVFGADGGRVTSNPAGIDCAAGSACDASFPKGTKVILTATPAPGGKLTWRGLGCSGTGTCNTTMTKTKTLNVRFY